MSKDLYFIKLLSQALANSQPRDALRNAFKKIERLGSQANYKKGYEQFQALISLMGADAQQEFIDPEIWRKAIADWQESAVTEAAIPHMVLERAGEIIARLQVNKDRPVGIVTGLTPGSYLLRLDSGWVLWKGELRKADLIWRHAFPEEPLPLAAETEPTPAKSSREVRLLEGEVVIKITPGIRSGRMEIIYHG